MQKFLKKYSIGLSLVANKSSTIYTNWTWFILPHVNILKSAFSSFYLPLTGEDKNIMTSINLTMCFSFKQQQAAKKNMSRYLQGRHALIIFEGHEWGGGLSCDTQQPQ